MSKHKRCSHNSDVATASKHYRRRGSVVSPARGFALADQEGFELSEWLKCQYIKGIAMFAS